jgi:hypothetical protein
VVSDASQRRCHRTTLLRNVANRELDFPTNGERSEKECKQIVRRSNMGKPRRTLTPSSRSKPSSSSPSGDAALPKLPLGSVPSILVGHSAGRLEEPDQVAERPAKGVVRPGARTVSGFDSVPAPIEGSSVFHPLAGGMAPIGGFVPTFRCFSCERLAGTSFGRFSQVLNG